MRKRILSVVITAVMVLSSFTAVFAADYDGIKPLKTAEGLLDQLNADAGADIFDKAQHEEQLAALKAINDNFDTLAASADWSDYIDTVYTNREVPYIENYMKTLALAEANPESQIATQLAAVDAQYDTAGDSLKESFAQLQNYKTEMQTVFENNRAALNDYTLTDAQIKEYILMPTKLVYHVIFSELGAGNEDADNMEYNYSTSWLGDDHAKKLYAMLFGEALTSELASDEDNAGVVSQVKEYMGTSAGLSYINSQLSNVFVADEEDFVTAVYKMIGDVLYKAYEGETVQADIQMLFGGNGVTGAFEYGMKALDTDCSAANVILNLFLSQYVQTQIDGKTLTTITSATTIGSKTRETLEDNSTIKFIPENIFDEYGIGSDSGVRENLSYRTSWFKLVCYAEDSANPGTFIDNSEYVTCSGSSFNVEKKDTSKGSEYPAYLVLYRKAVDDTNNTFIESYPITVVNKVKTSPRGNGGGTTRYTLSYESNGGTQYTKEYYSKGKTVELTKKPVKDGYTFDGWHLDKELTKDATTVIMSNDVTVYAAWVEAAGADIPDKLNGKDHFAYVIGYPEGDVRPQANITRAEAVTILFRLLNDDVREANLATENNFADVNEGDWFNTAVSTLAALDIVNGRTETEFMPNEYITRAEFAAIFARFSEEEYSVADEFTDVQGHWAEDEIHEAAAYGWIMGYEDNSFRPNQRITRAEAMTLINRVLKRIPETAEDLHADMVKWTDNSNETAWYYVAIQEATNSHEYEMKNNVNEKWTKVTENRDWTEYEK